MNFQKYSSPQNIVLTAFALVLIAVGGYFYAVKKNQPPLAENSPIEEPQKLQFPPEEKKIPLDPDSEFLGLWKSEIVYKFDPGSEKWGAITPTPLDYFQFKKNQTFCRNWNTNSELECAIYEKFFPAKEAILSVETDPYSQRYFWRIIGSKLELTSQVWRDGEWATSTKYVVSSTTFDEVERLRKAELAKPKIKSLDILVRKASSGEVFAKEAVVRCSVVDDASVSRVWISVRHTKDNVNRTREAGLESGDSQNGIWMAGGFSADSVGEYMIFCTADDNEGNSAKMFSRTITVPEEISGELKF